MDSRRGGCGPYFRAASGRRCESLGLFAVSGYAHRRRWEQTPGWWGLWCLGKIYPWKSQKLTVGLRVLLIADARPRTRARECKQIGEPRGQHAYSNILWERWSREEFPDYLDAPTDQIWARTKRPTLTSQSCRLIIWLASWHVGRTGSGPA